MANILFVSCFINIYNIPLNHEKHEWRIRHFTHLLKTGIHILVFISPEYQPIFELLRKIYTQLSYMVINIYTEFPLFIHHPITPPNPPPILPSLRNETKDTYDYMALMNSKLECMIRAIRTHPHYTYYSWIDFNISYIFKDADYTLSFLRFITTCQFNDSFLYIPGCWEKDARTDICMEHVVWRFCGGFFIGDTQSIIQFYEASYNAMFDTLIHTSRMVWETNYWSFLESTGRWIPTHWTMVSDHDDTMITKIPTELYIRPLQWTYRQSFDTSFFSDELRNACYGFHMSSISYCKTADNIEYLICRMINYSLSQDGKQYIFQSSNHSIQNKNVLVNMTRNTAKELIIEPKNTDSSFSQGLEDIRIYSDMSFSANSISHTTGKIPQIVYGNIDQNTEDIINMHHIQSPRGIHECEKNWIFLSCDSAQTTIQTITQTTKTTTQTTITKYVIYRWNPFELAILHDTNYIQRILSITLTPRYIFRNMRGSTSFIPFLYENKNHFIGIVHYSIDQSPHSHITRKYFHCFVLLDATTYIPYKLSHPFTFSDTQGIEFCIGMRMRTNTITCWVSIMDSHPMEYYIDADMIDFTIDVGIQSHIPL